MDKVLSQGVLPSLSQGSPQGFPRYTVQDSSQDASRDPSQELARELSQDLSVEVSPEESNLDAFHEECGVFGVFGHPEAANLAYLGMYALQHRGQESAGIVSSNGKSLISHRGMGLVADIFNSEVINRLEGTAAIGHNRYSTTGSTSLKNCQPLVVEYAGGGLALAHNGNLVNFAELRERLEASGSLFQSSSDSEVIIHLIAGSHAPTLAERVAEALAQVRGAYSLVVLAQREMIAVRDPHGFRPLVLGSLNGAPIVASETCALDLVRADYIREIEPGEMVVIKRRRGALAASIPARRDQAMHLRVRLLLASR